MEITLMTLAEAAHFLRVTPRTAARWIELGKLPYIQLVEGSRIMIDKHDLEEILTKNKKVERKR